MNDIPKPSKSNSWYLEADRVIKEPLASTIKTSKLIKDIEKATNAASMAMEELRESLNKFPAEYLYSPTGVCLECGIPFSDASTVCKRCAPLKKEGKRGTTTK